MTDKIRVTEEEVEVLIEALQILKSEVKNAIDLQKHIPTICIVSIYATMLKSIQSKGRGKTE